MILFYMKLITRRLNSKSRVESTAHYFRLVHNSIGILFCILVFQQLWVYLLIGIFYSKFNCCAWVYILKFCHLKIVSGAADARKLSAKWRNFNISDIFMSSSSIEGLKQWRRPETFAPCIGIMPSEWARRENDFLVLRKIVLTLVTFHVQEDLRGLMKIV